MNTSLFQHLTIARKECIRLSRLRQTEGMTKLCQAVNRLWQDELNKISIKSIVCNTSVVNNERR